MDVSVESNLSQLKKEFYSQVAPHQAATRDSASNTLALLTKEELEQLAKAWIELAVWKDSQRN